MNVATSRPRLWPKSDSRGRGQSIRLVTRRRGNARPRFDACARFGWASRADGASERGTLGVSKPLRSRIFLTPGVWALCGGQAAVICPLTYGLIGGIRLPDAARRHSGWITRLGRTNMRQNALLRSGKGLAMPGTARKNVSHVTVDKPA